MLIDIPGDKKPNMILVAIGSEIAIAIEQASIFGWEYYVGGSSRVVGIQTFDASVLLKESKKEFGFESERVVIIV